MSINLWSCPKCSNILLPTEDNPHYFICTMCVEGWTEEELKGIIRYKQILKEREH